MDIGLNVEIINVCSSEIDFRNTRNLEVIELISIYRFFRSHTSNFCLFQKSESEKLMEKAPKKALNFYGYF